MLVACNPRWQQDHVVQRLSDIDSTSSGNSDQTDVITLVHGLLLCGIMQCNTIFESYMQWLIIKMVMSSYSKLLCLQH